MGLMQFLHKNKLDLSLICLIGGSLVFLLCILAVVAEEGGTGLGNDIAHALGSWTYWLTLLSGTLAVAGGYYFFDYIRKLKEFNRLMAMPGKSKFIKNQDRVEELAWRLSQKHEEMVIKKKKELRIK